MTAWYNENNEYAADWLEVLIAGGHIAPGVVDRRSILDVRPADLDGYDQCHFFAGIGIWSAAARDAGIRDDEHFWSASCPCQPFSAAGQGGGFDDERHLWPALHWLVEQRRPKLIFGEQVASKDGLAWLDLVSADMEGSGYALGAVDTCAAGFGAPHIRQRLYWAAKRHCERAAGERSRVANAERSGWHAGAVPRAEGSAQRQMRREPDSIEPAIAVGLVADSGHDERSTRPARSEQQSEASVSQRAGRDCENGRMGEPDSGGRPQGHDLPPRPHDNGSAAVADGGGMRPGPVNGFWRDPDWLHCRDGKWRPVEAGTFPLAHGERSRVGKLRAYGNQIVRPQAAAFIEAYLGRTADLSVVF